MSDQARIGPVGSG